MNLKKYAALGVVTALLLHGAACAAPTERIPDAMLGAMIMCSFEGTELTEDDPFLARVRASRGELTDDMTSVAVRDNSGDEIVLGVHETNRRHGVVCVECGATSDGLRDEIGDWRIWHNPNANLRRGRIPALTKLRARGVAHFDHLTRGRLALGNRAREHPRMPFYDAPLAPLL